MLLFVTPSCTYRPVSLGLFHMLLFAGCHSPGGVDMGYRLLFCSAFFTFVYNA